MTGVIAITVRTSRLFARVQPADAAAIGRIAPEA
jgi:hypothetical protein